MARACTICTHTQRAEIELSVANGASNRDIALQFSVGHMAVQRHMADHISKQASKQQAMREEAKTLDVLAQLRAINATTLRILQETQRDKKTYGLALQAIDRVCKQIELQARLLGDLAETHIDIHQSPDWLNMRELIFHALEPFPEARIAIAEAIYQEGQRGRDIA